MIHCCVRSVAASTLSYQYQLALMDAFGISRGARCRCITRNSSSSSSSSSSSEGAMNDIQQCAFVCSAFSFVQGGIDRGISQTDHSRNSDDVGHVMTEGPRCKVG